MYYWHFVLDFDKNGAVVGAVSGAFHVTYFLNGVYFKWRCKEIGTKYDTARVSL